MFKYPIYKQDNNYSCGAYCMKMILKYYHLDIEIKEIKERCKVTNEGISVYGIIKCFESYHLDAKAYQSDLNTLLKETKSPCIIHLLNGELTHYVVLYRATKKYLLIGDPAHGLTKRTKESIEKDYTGICICIHHVGRYRVSSRHQEQSFISFIILHLKNNYCYIIRLVAKAILISCCSVLGSYYFQGLVDQINGMNYIMILIFTGVFMIISGIRIMINFQRKQLEIEIQRYLNQEYVNKSVVNMLYLPFSYYYRNQEGVLLTKVQNLFQLSDFFIHFYMALFVDLILIIGLLSALILFSMNLALVVIAFLSIITIVTIKWLKIVNGLNKQIVVNQEIMNQGHLEYLKNIYNSHQFFLKKFIKEKLNYLFEEYNYSLYQRDSELNKLNFISETLIQLLSFGVVLLASFHYKKGSISVGDIIFFYMLVSYMIEPMFNVIAFIIKKDEILILYERYKEIIPNRSEKKQKIRGRISKISFDHISYSYGYSKPILQHLDLQIERSLWLKGDTGVGKSTLLKLLMKYDELLKGHIYINGIDLMNIDTNSLYRKIIYLDRKPVFYHESLRFNLILNSKEEELMEKLLKIFGLNYYLDRLDLIIETDGQPLSSGQAQIVMLIRAIIKKPEVLILDEALCNIDDYKAKKIISYIHDNLPNTIMIIVAHQTKLVNELFDCAIIRDGKIYK